MRVCRLWGRPLSMFVLNRISWDPTSWNMIKNACGVPLCATNASVNSEFLPCVFAEFQRGVILVVPWQEIFVLISKHSKKQWHIKLKVFLSFQMLFVFYPAVVMLTRSTRNKVEGLTVSLLQKKMKRYTVYMYSKWYSQVLYVFFSK